jgi:protein-S-isoprenylcysteine O-methyltransferase Ste14
MVLRWITGVLVMVLLLFVPTGRFTWMRGWVFLAVLLSFMITSALILWRVNPEIFAARRRIQPGTKHWDQILVRMLMAIVFSILPVAALDAGRFGWTRMPGWGIGLGYGLLAIGMGLAVWAQAVNRFFEPGVRIQTDRGHHVIDRGPYAYIRHPGYVAACLMFAGSAMSLGSWWALTPVGLGLALLLVRISWEERTLRAELPGYVAYAERVRYRLIPGVW